MRIAFVVGRFPTLSETFILNQVTGLLDRGHDVEVFASEPSRDPKIHRDVSRYDLLSRTFYRHLPATLGARYVRAPVCLLRAIRTRPLACLRALDLRTYGAEALYLELLYSVAQTAGHGPYHVLHCHFGPSGRWAVMLRDLGALRGKIVTSFHGYDVHEAGVASRYTSLFQKGDLFTVNSDFTRRRAVELGAPPGKIVKLPVGLRLEEFQPAPHVSRQRPPIEILTVARLVEKKGLKYSIRAVAHVAREYPELGISYRIAGAGPLEDALRSLVRELGAVRTVTFLGPCDRAEVRRLYQQAHVFVLASVTASNGDMEGQGLVLQEAQAAALPVVSTVHNGIPEGVLDGVSGFLVPERDVEALAGRIEQLVRDPQLRARMGREGRAFVKQHYDIERLNDRLVGIYRSLTTTQQADPRDGG